MRVVWHLQQLGLPKLCVCLSVAVFTVVWVFRVSVQQKSGHGGVFHAEAPRLLTWQDFGIIHHQFFGSHNNVTYQANVWLRMVCQQQQVDVQVVAAWHRTPFDTRNGHGHVLFPDDLLTDGAFPDIWFERRDQGCLTDIRKVQHHDEKPIAPWRYSAQSGNTSLEHGYAYTMHMLGSEVQHEVITHACSNVHPLFAGKHPGWVVAVSEASHNTVPSQHAWLVAQHARHHKCLGMNGLILVTTPSKAYALLKHPDTAHAMQTGALVVVSWVSIHCLRCLLACTHRRRSRSYIRKPEDNIAPPAAAHQQHLCSTTL